MDPEWVNGMTKKTSVLRYQCGSNAGYYQHNKEREYPCLPCTNSHAEWWMAYRIKTGRAKTIQVSMDVIMRWVAEPASILADHLPDIVVSAIEQRTRNVMG